MNRLFRSVVNAVFVLAVTGAGVAVRAQATGETGGWDPNGPGAAVKAPAGAATKAADGAPPATREAKISPAARELIAQVGQAYTGLKGLELAGTLRMNLDVGGEKQDQNLPFTGRYQAPGLFRHEAKGDVVLGSTGEKAYVLAVGDNAYVQGDAPKDAKGARDYLPQLASILNTQNPSLALALASDPAADLIRAADLLRGAQAIDRGDDSTINGAKYPTLNVDAGAAGPAAVLAFDPTTKLLRRATYDLKPAMQRSGAVDVKTATLVIDYDVAKPGDGATGDRAAFAWAPPAGAKEVSADGGAGGADAAVAMQGKPAPDFTLKDLAGKDVKLSDLKGSVVVLDFWATWCGPCVASLPELDAVYKEKSAAGLKMFAVNQQEEKGKVQSFMTAKGLQIPVLLDVSGDAAAKYKVEGLPTTVVVDKEGVVRKVFVGVGPEGAGPVKKVVEELMK